ncbi:MAG: META domain-containing protein [bacterium]
MRTSLKFWGLLVGMALVAVSCGSAALDTGKPTTSLPPNDSPPAPSIDGTSWVVTGGTLDGAALVPIKGRAATLSVQADRATGSTGCNTYHATISITSDGVVSFTGFAVTEIGCEPDAMRFESGMLTVMRNVDRFAWDADRLTLSNADGSATLDLAAAVPEPDVALDGGTWLLAGIASSDVASSAVAGTRPFLVVDLAAGAVRGNGGCNDFGAQVTFDGDRMLVSDMVYTEIACDEAVMRNEADYFRILTDAATWRIDGSTLVIATTDGEALTFGMDSSARPEDAAVAWVAAVAAGDLDTAATLMAPASLAYVDQRGGLAAFSTELAEGWGAWARAEDRRVWSVTSRFPDGTEGTSVMFAGIVEQEGMTERKAVSLLTVKEDGRCLVHPFTETEQVGFVVP